MRCLLIALNNGRTFESLSELLRAFLSGGCKYRLHSRNSVFVTIADTTRLWKSSRFFQFIFCLGSPAYSLTKRIARKALSFSADMVNTLLPFKLMWLVKSRHICLEKLKDSLEKFRKITYAVTDFFQRKELVRSMHANVDVQNSQCVFSWLFCAFDLKTKWKEDSGLYYDNYKVKRHVKKVWTTSSQQDVRLTKTHLSLILYSSLKLRQVKNQLFPLCLQHLAKYCHLMFKDQ